MFILQRLPVNTRLRTNEINIFDQNYNKNIFMSYSLLQIEIQWIVYSRYGNCKQLGVNGSD